MMDLQTFENLAVLAGSRRLVLEGLLPGSCERILEPISKIVRERRNHPPEATWYWLRATNIWLDETKHQVVWFLFHELCLEVIRELIKDL